MKGRLRPAAANAPARWLETFDARLLAPGSAHRLACVRTVLAASIAVRLAVGEWSPLAGRPDVLFRPVGVTHLLGGVPSVGVIVTIQVVGLVAAVLAVTGRWPRATLLAGWLALLVLAGVHTSAGKIMHNDVLLLLATVPMLFAPAGARIGMRAQSRGYGWAPRASLVVVAGVYALTGAQKVLHSGPAWVASDNMSWVLYQGAGAGLAPELARWLAAIPLLPSVFAGGALFLELLAPVILAVRRTRPLYVLAAALMHGSIGLFLGLDYSSWVLTVAAVALPWDSLRARSLRRDDDTHTPTAEAEAERSASGSASRSPER